MIRPRTAPRPPATSRLGAYEIIRTLAEGGMAELFLARLVGPQAFEKLVVLKTILPHYADDARYVRLFLDEARLGACLQHPNIVQVYDIGFVDGRYCYSMEYVHGADLRAVLARSVALQMPVPIEHVVTIATQLAAALHYAHDLRGPDRALLKIVHRDVSPSNIQLSYDGAIKLLDFGIAKTEASSIQTAPGTLKGKAGYMSPEQVRREPVDRRSDLFSLGIVLWEMLAGIQLYEAPSELRIGEMILEHLPPPPSTVRRDCTAELDAIVMRALAHSPDARFQTARELQQELVRFARSHGLAPSPIALSEHLRVLFDAEIRAAESADAAASITRTDHAPRPDDSWLGSDLPTRVRIPRRSPNDSMSSEAPTPALRDSPSGGTVTLLHPDADSMRFEEPTRSLGKERVLVAAGGDSMRFEAPTRLLRNPVPAVAGGDSWRGASPESGDDSLRIEAPTRVGGPSADDSLRLEAPTHWLREAMAAVADASTGAPPPSVVGVAFARRVAGEPARSPRAAPPPVPTNDSKSSVPEGPTHPRAEAVAPPERYDAIPQQTVPLTERIQAQSAPARTRVALIAVAVLVLAATALVVWRSTSTAPAIPTAPGR